MAMAAKTARDIQELLRSEPFLAWFRTYNRLRDDIKNARTRQQDLIAQAEMMTLKAEFDQRAADDRIFEAGEHEDASATAHAEFAEIENTAFESLSAFEQERRTSGKHWADNDRLEKVLDDHRQRTADVKARIAAAREARTPAGNAEAERFEARGREMEQQLAGFVKDAEQAHQRMLGTNQQRDKLWTEVEALWMRSFRANMARAEHAYRSKRSRVEAEELFALAAAERRRTDGLQQEREGAAQHLSLARAQYAALLRQGEEQFACTLIDEFIFWTRPDDVDNVWCVPLIDERRHLNIQVAMLQLYQVAKAAGVDFIEPIPETPDAAQHDARLDIFFNSGRPYRSAPHADGKP